MSRVSVPVQEAARQSSAQPRATLRDLFKRDLTWPLVVRPARHAQSSTQSLQNPGRASSRVSCSLDTGLRPRRASAAPPPPLGLFLWVHRGPVLMRACAVRVQAGVGLMVLQQFSGANAVMFYSGTIFRAAGVHSADAAAFTCGLLQVSRRALLRRGAPSLGQR